MHWADKVAGDLLRRGKKHVIETGTSISGVPHIGNAGDVIRGDAIRKALLSSGVEANFLWVADDSDPFRKVPRGICFANARDISSCDSEKIDHHPFWTFV